MHVFERLLGVCELGRARCAHGAARSHRSALSALVTDYTSSSNDFEVASLDELSAQTVEDVFDGAWTEEPMARAAIELACDAVARLMPELEHIGASTLPRMEAFEAKVLRGARLLPRWAFVFDPPRGWDAAARTWNQRKLSELDALIARFPAAIDATTRARMAERLDTRS